MTPGDGTAGSNALQSVVVPSADGDLLTPANPQPHVVLPPPSRSAHESPRTGGSVMTVYDDALCFVDQVSAMRGMMATGGLVLSPLMIWQIAEWWGRDSWMSSAFNITFLAVALAFIQADFVGFRVQPVLVDRKTRQVHVFIGHMLPWWQWFWKVWGKSGYEVQSFDWRCVRAEVVQLTIFTGQIPRRESGLVLAFTDVPGGTSVVQRVGLGPTSAYGDTDSLLRRWEHVRRFMEEGGPLWVAGDEMFLDGGTTLRDALTFLQPLLSKDFADQRETAEWWWFWPWGVFWLIGWPLTAFIGMVRWLSYVLKAEPVWPPDVQEQLGRPLSQNELDDRFKPKEPTIVGRKKRRLRGEQ